MVLDPDPVGYGTVSKPTRITQINYYRKHLETWVQVSDTRVRGWLPSSNLTSRTLSTWNQVGRNNIVFAQHLKTSRFYTRSNTQNLVWGK